MLERFLLLWLVLLSAAAYFWPHVASYDPFVASRPGLDYLFAVTMFAVGSLLPRDEVEQVARRWPTVLAGTAIQYATMPALAYGFARWAGLEGDMLLGVVLVGCVPGAMASNVLTLLARGNVSYSLSLTTMATLLSPLIVPFALRLTVGEQIDLPTRKIMLKLCWIVVLPVIAGHLISRANSSWYAAARRYGPIVANLAILWIIAVVVALNRDRLGGTTATLAGLLLALNLVGYTAGLLGGLLLRLPAPMRRALSLEVGMQNAGLGTVLALSVFAGREQAAIPTALYTFGCMLTGTLLARSWAILETRAPSGTSRERTAKDAKEGEGGEGTAEDAEEAQRDEG